MVTCVRFDVAGNRRSAARLIGEHADTRSGSFKGLHRFPGASSGTHIIDCLFPVHCGHRIIEYHHGTLVMGDAKRVCYLIRTNVGGQKCDPIAAPPGLPPPIVEFSPANTEFQAKEISVRTKSSGRFGRGRAPNLAAAGSNRKAEIM
jgi:hypothetical protein